MKAIQNGAKTIKNDMKITRNVPKIVCFRASPLIESGSEVADGGLGTTLLDFKTASKILLRIVIRIHMEFVIFFEIQISRKR